jgi:hypothetical protein
MYYGLRVGARESGSNVQRCALLFLYMSKMANNDPKRFNQKQHKKQVKKHQKQF